MYLNVDEETEIEIENFEVTMAYFCANGGRGTCDVVGSGESLSSAIIEAVDEILPTEKAEREAYPEGEHTIVRHTGRPYFDFPLELVPNIKDALRFFGFYPTLRTGTRDAIERELCESYDKVIHDCYHPYLSLGAIPSSLDDFRWDYEREVFLTQDDMQPHFTLQQYWDGIDHGRISFSDPDRKVVVVMKVEAWA
jgi:hypothetical protein